MDADGEHTGMAGFTKFPNEVVLLILEQLDLESLLECHDVCRSWRRYSLFEFNYIPYVLDAYTQLTYGTRPLPAGLKKEEKCEYLRRLFNTSVSALPVFAECQTLRDIAIKLHELEKSWLSGRNTGFAQLNRPGIHQMPIMAVAIDAQTGSIVTGDSGGVVAFWNISTGACYYKSRFPFSGPQWAIPMHIVIEGDLMVIGTPVGGVIVATRNIYGEPFVRVAEFWTHTNRVTSIRMEQYICIIGEVGSVSIWDLSECIAPPSYLNGHDTNRSVRLLMTIDTQSESAPVDASPNFSLFYRDGLLFLGLAGSQIQQIAAHSRKDRPVEKQLWETDEYTYASLASGPAYRGRREWGKSLLCPIGAHGDIVVSWADSSIYRLSSTMEGDIVWEPRSECLVPAVNGRESIGVHARGDQIICRFLSHEIEMFSKDGEPIRTIPCEYGEINCMTGRKTPQSACIISRHHPKRYLMDKVRHRPPPELLCDRPP
ncbi:hypothetical protein ABW19_dt0202519 [Dactylella cylindrospora]|nr:hypothetical protein ABW19_dt0202519 [Dactylella cylindrospora]